MGQKIAIMCRAIEKTFHAQDTQTIALRGVDLEVREGEFLMLAGPSGCGKTTFISVLAGILTPDKGECIVGGHAYHTMSQRDMLAFRARHLGFIFQSFNLISSLNVAENVFLPLMIQGKTKAQALEAAYDVLEEVDLLDRAQSSVLGLSGGQQQRVAIARALVHKPSLIICDEPTSALDHATGVRILELMKKINRQTKATYVIVTHDARIYEYADRIAHMDDGHIVRIENISGEKNDSL